MRDRVVIVDILTKKFKSICYKQYDENNELNIVVYEGKTLANISNYIATVYFELPSGKVYEVEGTIKNNTIKVMLSSSILEEYGQVNVECELFNLDEVVTTFTFYLNVEKSISRISALNPDTQHTHLNLDVLNQITQEMVDSIGLNSGLVDLSIYQTKRDITLETDNKTVSGAINELNEKIENTSVNIDLSDYALKSEIPTVPTKVSQLQNDKGYLTEVPSEYVTESELNTELSTKADITDIPSLEGYATETYVTNKIAEASLSGGEVDLSGYATKDELSTKANVSHTHTMSNITDLIIPDVDKAYVDTQLNTKANKSDIPNLDGYALKTDIPTVPTKTSQLTNDSNFISSIPSEYITEEELETKGYLTEHQDISGKADKSEIPTKVSDLANDSNFLTSIPLEYITESELNAKGYLTEVPSEYITEIELESKGYLTEHQSLEDYALKTELPSVPTKTSQLTNDSGFITSIPSEYVTEQELNTGLSAKANKSEILTKTDTIAPEMTTFIVEKEYTQPGETIYTDLGIEISNEFTTYIRDDDNAMILEKVTYTEAASIYIDTTVNKKFRVTQTNANRWRVLYFTETFENIVDGQQPYSYTQSDYNIPSSSIITADSNINCIVIGIGWEATNPTITVEKITKTVGTTTTNLFLDDNIKINSSNVIGDVQFNTGSSSTQNKYIVFGNAGIYKSTNTVVPSTATQASEIYSNYDSLMSSYPNYITKQELGVDDFGNSIYCYTFKKERPTILSSISSDNEIASATWDSNYQPTFLLTSGVHGDERGAVIVLYQYLKNLCESTDVEELEFVKNNAVLMVIPLVNPSGYNANTRYNGNSVDLNRDFYTGSEAETQIIRTFIQANIEEIDHVYDCHNTTDKASIWSVPNRFAECLFLSMATQLVPYWKTLNASLTDPFVFYKLMADVGGLDEWVNKLGVPAITLEISYHTNGLLGITTESTFDAFAVQVGIDVLGNAIIGGIKYLS